MESFRLKPQIQQSLYWFLRIFLGLFLLTAAVGKVLDIPGYVAVIRTYEVGLPVWMRWVAAIAIIILEMGLALWLLSGWSITTGASVSMALHMGYFIFLGITLLRGIHVPNCGCFGVFLARPLELGTLLEDLVLVTLSWGLYVLAKTQADKP